MDLYIAGVNCGDKSQKVNRKELIAHLETLANSELPEAFYGYDEDELSRLVSYANDLTDFQNAGLEKLFESMSLAMKYIPNFVLISLTKRFLEAPLAARITQKLSIKQVTTVGNGLPAAYLAEVTYFQEPQLSGNILAKLKRQHALDILTLLCANRPLKVLDLYVWLTDDLQRFVAKTLKLQLINEPDLHSTSRRNAYRRLTSARP